MPMDSTDSHHHTTSINRMASGRDLVLAPLKKPGTIRMVASMAVACVDVARALGGIYLYALYQHTVGRITNKE